MPERVVKLPSLGNRELAWAVVQEVTRMEDGAPLSMTVRFEPRTKGGAMRMRKRFVRTESRLAYAPHDE